VFFNPAASVNRDVSIAIAAACGGGTFCDAMAGVGARGVRVANEVEHVEKVTLIDFNAEAIRVARRAASLNRVRGKCEFVAGETNATLDSRYGRGERFGLVDVDPFGSPVRQLQAAISTTSDGGILSVTATDAAALCGVYPRVARRRYGAASLNNHFHHETGIRILINAINKQAASMDVGISPVASHSTRHYLRVFVRLAVGGVKADLSLGNEGYVEWCPACGTTSSSGERQGSCRGCGQKTKVAGPLWIGRLTERRVVRKAAAEGKRRGFVAAAKILISLDGVDIFPPWSYSIEGICSSLRMATVPETEVREHLSRAGYRSCRQPFEDTGLKTDAPIEAVRDAVRESGGRRRVSGR
jgi:tRNA (guanine26-N2/guanine27-N2)-dimethyltransferase